MEFEYVLKLVESYSTRNQTVLETRDQILYCRFVSHRVSGSSAILGILKIIFYKIVEVVTYARNLLSLGGTNSSHIKYGRYKSFLKYIIHIYARVLVLYTYSYMNKAITK